MKVLLLLPLVLAFEFDNSETRDRNLKHVHLQTADLYGNSTDMQYFYVMAHFGTQHKPQALILDTGSSIAAIPCAEYCHTNDGQCGSHIDGLYHLQNSQTS